jgi:hypothetical protein
MSSLQNLLDIWTEEIKAISSVLYSIEKSKPRTDVSIESIEHEYAGLACYFAGLVGQYEIGLRTAKHFKIGSEIERKLSLVRLHFNGAADRLERKKRAIDFAKNEIEKLYDLNINNSEQAFLFACELRHLLAVNRSLLSEDLALQTNRLSEIFISKFNSLSATDKHRTSRGVVNLLSEYKIYPSVQLANRTELIDSHWALFKSANLNRSENMSIYGLNETLEKSKVDSGLKKIITSVLASIQEIASEHGRGTLSVVGDERAMPWPNGLSDVTIIPGDGRGSCSRVLLAIADSSKRSGRSSPKIVMTQVQQAIIRCRGTLKAVIFLSDPSAMGSEVEDHLPIIQDNILVGDIDIFIPVTILGKRLSVLEWK